MNITSTFSIAARCPLTGQLGVIVTSSSPAVGARCPKVKAQTGAILSQNVTDPRLGEIGLAMLEKQYNAGAVINALKHASDYPEYRQLAIVDNHGYSAVFTGEKALGVHGEYSDDNVACIGNLLSDPDIPKRMGEYFLRHSEKTFAERLISSIGIGFEMGGELDDEHSIALLIYKDQSFPYMDLRVDYSEDPLRCLKKLYGIYASQADDYEKRALSPVQAPSYGVKGDL